MKQLEEMPICIAPEIYGRIRDGRSFIHDKRDNRELDYDKIDDQITIYERQVRGWFLDYSRRLKADPECGFVVLMICLSYIEGVEQYRRGRKSNGKSREFFVDGAQRILGSDVQRSVLGDLYRGARNSLFHDGMVRNLTISNNEEITEVVRKDGNKLRINIPLFVQKVEEDFDRYVQELREADDNSECRNNFCSIFQIIPTESS